MNRLTKDDVKEMGMLDLAHNQVFIKDGEAWYRDFGREISIRDLAKEMFDFHNIKYSQNLDEFDEDMMYLLEDDYQTIEGVIALFYRSLWAFADIREILKAYEDTGLKPEEIFKGIELLNIGIALHELKKYKDLEEQGLLIKLPCKVGDTVYKIEDDKTISKWFVFAFTKYDGQKWVVRAKNIKNKWNYVDISIMFSAFDETVFLTREEAEKALEAENE